MSTALEPRVSELESSLKELAYAQLRTERSLEELANELKDFKNEMKDFKDEARRQSKEMNKRWGDLANRLGTVVEDIVAPNVPGVMARYFGADEPDVLMIRPRKKHPQDPAKRREFDLIAVTPDTIFINETKTRVKPEDVTAFAENHREVVDYFPEYAGRRVVPIMSSLSLTEDVTALLTRHGIYAMAMADDTMDLLNFDDLNG